MVVVWWRVHIGVLYVPNILAVNNSTRCIFGCYVELASLGMGWVFLKLSIILCAILFEQKNNEKPHYVNESDSNYFSDALLLFNVTLMEGAVHSQTSLKLTVVHSRDKLCQ